MIKLNIGSGQRPFGGDWINIDCRKQGFYKVDIIADVKLLPIFEDNSVDIIVAHHLFEHIALNEQEEYLGEWYRILKLGGKLLVCVPNLRELAKAWLDNKISTFIFMVNCYGAYQGFEGDLHRWGYDPQELYDRLCCWNKELEIIKFKWQNPKEPDLSSELYKDHDIAVDWWIILMELTK